MAYKYKNGTYRPRNPEKYQGSYPIRYRSSWELVAFKALDNNPNVLHWGSESVVIDYLDPTRHNTKHRYFMDLDFSLQIENSVQKYIVEIKPKCQTKRPVRGKKKEHTFVKESMDFTRNCAKWEAAVGYAKRRNIRFLIWTEDDLKITT